MTSDDEGEGGGSGYPPKMMTSFLNSPLVMMELVLVLVEIVLQCSAPQGYEGEAGLELV